MDGVHISVTKLFICLLLFYAVKSEIGGRLEEEMELLRKDMWTEIRKIQDSLKEVSQEREKILDAISVACNTKKYFQNAKTRMRELMTSFANISIELGSINMLKRDEEELRETTDGGFVLKDYKNAVQHIRSLHSNLDQLESQVWMLTFNRQIKERKLQKFNKKLVSSTFKSKVHKLAEWGIHAKIDTVIAESPTS